MRVGLLYDLFEEYPWRDGEPPDADAENEPLLTVEALEHAIGALGHEPVRIGTARQLMAQLAACGADAAQALGIDVAINIAEGAHHRGREGEVPTLLDMFGIPYIGSDALTLSLSLDKAWTKDLARQAGLDTPPWCVFRSASFGAETPVLPCFVKPRYEGAAKGISLDSKVNSQEALEAQVRRIVQDYRQDALVERFIEGAEYTVAVLGNAPARALPAIQRAIDPATGIGLHVLEKPGAAHGSAAEPDWALPGTLSPDLEARLQRAALRIHRKLECRDFSRSDFRVDADGTVWFLEINPLPTFAVDGTFAVMAELMGQTYTEFLASLLDDAFRDRME
ncbi:MAG: D-alanine--D-alanine ligase [Bacteroidetes bacterium CG12_big_fil_rev_8_21_14_0_65_60_17]|nr:MAG: D-alanine--D-alanine ligase [Bacteroidetes bacterium CG12_big_fil_rev_8_21_14_0_65_60_17]